MTQSSSSSGLNSTPGDGEPVVTEGLRTETTVTICNRLGMHSRPAMSFVDTASQYSATVHVSKQDLTVDGKSIMQVMMLAATQGTELKIIAEGNDSRDAVMALKELVERGFDEE